MLEFPKGLSPLSREIRSSPNARTTEARLAIAFDRTDRGREQPRRPADLRRVQARRGREECCPWRQFYVGVCVGGPGAPTETAVALVAVAPVPA